MAPPTKDDREMALGLAEDILGQAKLDGGFKVVAPTTDLIEQALADKGERVLEEAAKKIRAECVSCGGTGNGEPSDEDADGNVCLLECEYCGRPMKSVRSLSTAEGSGVPAQGTIPCGRCGKPRTLRHGEHPNPYVHCPDCERDEKS